MTKQIWAGQTWWDRRLMERVTVIHCCETQSPITRETHVACLVRTDDGRDFYASDRDLTEMPEQTSFLEEAQGQEYSTE
jgi:hypothetical protein